MARNIMKTGYTLAALMEEFHHHLMIFFNDVESLLRWLVVHEKELELYKNERGANYENNFSYMRLAGAASGKSLKKFA